MCVVCIFTKRRHTHTHSHTYRNMFVHPIVISYHPVSSQATAAVVVVPHRMLFGPQSAYPLLNQHRNAPPRKVPSCGCRESHRRIVVRRRAPSNAQTRTASNPKTNTNHASTSSSSRQPPDQPACNRPYDFWHTVAKRARECAIRKPPTPHNMACVCVCWVSCFSVARWRVSLCGPKRGFGAVGAVLVFCVRVCTQVVLLPPTVWSR